MAAGDVMTGAAALMAGDYITLRRGLGYRSRVSERYLRAFARYLDRAGHDGPVPLEASHAGRHGSALIRTPRVLVCCTSSPKAAQSNDSGNRRQ